MKKKNELVIYVDPGLKDLIPKFIAAQKAQLELVKSAFKKLNYADLKLLGHRMKGSCGGYGFSILGDLGDKIEKSAETQNIKLLSQSVDQLDLCLSNLKIEYRDK